MKDSKKKKNTADFEAALETLIDSLKRMDIEVKSDRGNFKGGLYRHNEDWIFYINRKATAEEKVELIVSELNSKNVPDSIFTMEMRDTITKIRESLS